MLHEEALGWVIRTRDPEFTEWDAFTLWLEADPAHAPAYDALLAADADLPDLLPA
jgi:transmembrane sensor